jgi:hypothetical protein
MEYTTLKELRRVFAITNRRNSFRVANKHRHLQLANAFGVDDA